MSYEGRVGRAAGNLLIWKSGWRTYPQEKSEQEDRGPMGSPSSEPLPSNQDSHADA